MSTTDPATQPTRPAAIQPWAVTLVGVVLILMLLVGLTL